LTITKGEIVQGLEDIGLPDGAAVLVHSSLSSFGHVQGGAEAVIDALLEAVGADGTVLVPTLTGHERLSRDNPPFFDPDQSEIWTGIIPNTFVKYPQAVRSLHPTHSVAAIGPAAVDLTSDHQYSVTPCDDTSPYGKLAKLENGYVLFLGVDHRSSTMLHHVEEVVGVPYHMQPGFVRATVVENGISREIDLMIHKYGQPRNFSVVEPILENRGIQSKGKIGSSTVRLVKAKEMVEVLCKGLMADGRLLLQDA
jgi:aminoglycoside 3-N-acetyltransferase